MMAIIKNRPRGRTFVLVALALVSLCLPQQAISAEKQKKPAVAKQKAPVSTDYMKSDSPLHIASDRMEVRQQDKTIVFQGHVVVRQDDLTITGNQLKVTAAQVDKSIKTDQSAIVDKIDRIEVNGDVKITQREKQATANQAVYYHQEQKIVLMGNPVVSQGQDKVQGRLITLYIAEGKSVVEGGEETPVQALLHPSRKEQ
jgi:lipopolysaccharide export system protein LptA